MCFPSVGSKLFEFLISFITYFSCDVLFSSSLFFGSLWTVEWKRNGLYYKRKIKKGVHHLCCSSCIVSVTCNFFFTSLIYDKHPHPLFFFFHTLVFSMSVSDSHNCCQYVLPLLLPEYLTSRESNSMFFSCFLITYYLSIYLYWLLSTGFLLRWEEHITMRLSAELIKFLCLKTKQTHLLSSTLGQQHICFLIFPWVVVITFFIDSGSSLMYFRKSVELFGFYLAPFPLTVIDTRWVNPCKLKKYTLHLLILLVHKVHCCCLSLVF